MSGPLIGLAGYRGSGKDTVARFIEEWAAEHGVFAASRALADQMKLSFVRLFIPDASRNEALSICDQLKTNGEITMRNTFVDDDHQRTVREHKISGRRALQRYGTEAHRDLFGDDFWLDILLPQDNWEQNFYDALSFPPNIFIVSDIRLDNEAQRIKDLGGQIWRVKRPTDNLVMERHRTEAQISNPFIDEVIENSYGLEDLKTKVNNLCDNKLNSILLPSSSA